MIILGIETSCDETSVALVENGTKILANIVSSSSKLQAKYGGVYPEVAAREQVKLIIPVLKQALSESKLRLKEVDAIAVTVGPGLIGSLLVGVETGKTLAFILNKPIIGVNHVFAHLYANFLIKSIPKFPFLCLIVSGGHTDLLLLESHQQFKLLGQTKDDAAGEAFDKCARILGLSYPGGPSIEKAAQKGKPDAYYFPRGMISSKDYNFSFSGLKTAVLREVKKISILTPRVKNNLAASIQKAIIDVLLRKTLRAADQYKPQSILLAGGVSANLLLREEFQKAVSPKTQLYTPPVSLCTDNAAFIASCAFFNNHFRSWKKIETDSSLQY